MYRLIKGKRNLENDIILSLLSQELGITGSLIFSSAPTTIHEILCKPMEYAVDVFWVFEAEKPRSAKYQDGKSVRRCGLRIILPPLLCHQSEDSASTDQALASEGGIGVNLDILVRLHTHTHTPLYCTYKTPSRLNYHTSPTDFINYGDSVSIMLQRMRWAYWTQANTL